MDIFYPRVQSGGAGFLTAAMRVGSVRATEIAGRLKMASLVPL